MLLIYIHDCKSNIKKLKIRFVEADVENNNFGLRIILHENFKDVVNTFE